MRPGLPGNPVSQNGTLTVENHESPADFVATVANVQAKPCLVTPFHRDTVDGRMHPFVHGLSRYKPIIMCSVLLKNKIAPNCCRISCTV